jgi:hypothetical protein
VEKTLKGRDETLLGEVRISVIYFLSAFAEDHGLCPWMNADSAVRSFVCRWANATADSATVG